MGMFLPEHPHSTINLKGAAGMAVRPKRLRKGDVIGIIAPASPPNQENLDRSLRFLDELGLQVKLGKHVRAEYGYLAGTDAERAEDLHSMFADPEIKGVICAGGGYGTARIARMIDYSLIRSNPKIFWGYSDITFLHQCFQKEAGLVTFHGPMLASDIGREHIDDRTKRSFRMLFEPEKMIYTEDISPLAAFYGGKAAGVLTGGNLSLLTSTLGTEFELDTKDKLLLIEDIHEEPRAVDRMLNQLYMSGKLQSAAGFIIGDFADCTPSREQSLSLQEVLEYYMSLVKKPVLSGFKIGHCLPNIAVPLGGEAILDADRKTLTIEAGVI